MTDMNEVSTNLYTIFDASQPDSLAVTLQHAALQADGMQQQVEAALAGSNNPLAETLRTEMTAIVLGIGEIAARLASAQSTSSALREAWGIGTAPVTATSERAQPTNAPIEKSTYPDNRSFNLDAEPFNPTHNLMDPAIQRRMNRSVERLFGPRSVGVRESHRILSIMDACGLHTVRDILLVGRRVAFGSLGREYRDLLAEEVKRVCPEVPFNNYLTAESIAQVTDSLDNVPIQTVLTTYRSYTRGKRVTVGETLHTGSNTYNNQGAVRNIGPEVAREIEQFARDFMAARRQIEQQQTPITHNGTIDQEPTE